MSKCNLLIPLGTGTSGYQGGTFWLFSQYTEDLTRAAAFGDAYRVVPSRFAAMDLPFGGSATNSGTAEIFQNKFEHSVAYWRHQLANQGEQATLPKFNPDIFTNLFWTVLNDTFSVCNNTTAPAIKWIGESDVVGTTEIDGDTYSEIYCFIANGDEPRSYHTSLRSIDGIDEDVQPESDSSLTHCYGWTAQTYPQLTGSSSSSSNVPASGVSGTSSLQTLPIGYQFTVPNALQPLPETINGSVIDGMASFHEAFVNNTNNVFWDEIPNPGESFNVNTIVLFYDIVAKDASGDYKYLYCNVPLGMYFTGPVDGSNLQNSITKFITNEDIYGQGTSYGLRVTTKFTCAPSVLGSGSDGGQVGSTHVINYGSVNWSDVAAVIDSMRSAADAVTASIEASSARHNELMNHLSQFRDKMANVPYIRTVGTVDYWFVNGRNTGRTVGGGPTINNIEELVEQAVAEAMEDAQTPDNQGNRYIQYIDPDTYYNDSTVTEINDLFDFHELEGAKCSNMFYGCSALQRIPRLEVNNSTNMSNMFYGCSSIQSIDLRESWNCTNFDYAFSGCSSAERIYIDGTSANSFTGTFNGCSNLKDLFIDNLRGKQSESAPLEINLAMCTNLTLASVVRIIDRVQYSGINQNNDPTRFIKLYLPSNMSSNFGVQCAAELALNNKGVKIILA